MFPHCHFKVTTYRVGICRKILIDEKLMSIKMKAKLHIDEATGNGGFLGGPGVSVDTYEFIKQNEKWYGFLIGIDPAIECVVSIAEIREGLEVLVGKDVEVCVEGSRITVAGTFPILLRDQIARYCYRRPEIVQYHQVQGSYYDFIHSDWVEKLPRRVAGQRR